MKMVRRRRHRQIRARRDAYFVESQLGPGVIEVRDAFYENAEQVLAAGSPRP
jgi:allantoicase